MEVKFIDKIPLKKIPIYYTNEYNIIFSKNDDAIYKNIEINFGKDKKIFIPIFIKEIEKDVYESYSAYGYSGFFSKNSELKDLFKDNFYVFEEFMKNNNIIDLFIRNSSFLSNEKFIDDKHNFLNRSTYLIELKKYKNIDDFARQANSKIRWSINYARKNKIKIEFKQYNELTEDDLVKFYEIYINTMKERNVSEYYLFNYEFMKEHFQMLKENCELALAINDQDEIISGALFLSDNFDMVHYHFSGLNRLYSKYQVGQLLLGEAIVRYSNMNKRYFHLGGGNSLDESDGLSRFKKKFSTQTYKYYISKLIFDEKKYYDIRAKYNILNRDMFLIKDALNF
ncbi:GNAT family N-acetyltransferase [Lutibacter sp. B2]|nr:GNAT family N-acetyltransferase [Lutibacter sp. B2]